ncbi:MAG TPA: septum formation initiator family protein [Candidatus Cloacimonadota bacterium]|nr:septum formation initiator family protein [Candidatus Cloacimonadota bacterium]
MKRDKRVQPAYVKWIYIAALVFVLSWVTLWGPNSFLRTGLQRHSLKKLESSVTALKAQNDSLRRENELLKTNLETAEKTARERFGLTKPGEKVFRFVPAASPKEEGK